MVERQGRRLHNPERVEQARRRLAGRKVQDRMAWMREALCDPARLQIVEALGAGELSVGDLAAVIGRAPAATSQHLRVLRELDLVEGVRSRTSVYYRLRPGRPAAQLQAVLDALGQEP